MVYGPVEWYRHEPMLAMEGRDGIAALAPYKLDPLLTGIIAWTAHDHYTFHPASKKQRGRVRLVGVMNLFRYPYPETHFYPVELKNEPYLYIASDWKKELNEVIVYSNTDEVELLLNGKSIARQKPDHTGMNSAFDHPPFRFLIETYEPGKLTARGWTGKQILAEQSIFTPEEATSLRLEVDTSGRKHTADGSDIMLAYAYVVDNHGMIIKDKVVDVKFSIKGPAVIIGKGTDISANPMPSRFGMSPVLIQAGLKPGKITLEASAKGLKSAIVNWQSIESKPKINLTEVPVFYDSETLSLDLGAQDQLLQYGWKPWIGKDGENAEIFCAHFGNFKARLSTVSADGWLRWLGEMNVMGKYGYAAGEGVLALDDQGLVLEISDLSKGNYQIKTFHHCPKVKYRFYGP